MDNNFFLDEDLESLEDFYLAFSRVMEDIEVILTQLQVTPSSRQLMDDLICESDSILGRAELLQITPLVETFHALEHLFDRIRNNNLIYIPILSDVLLGIYDRLLVMADDAAETGSIRLNQWGSLQKALGHLVRMTSDSAHQAIDQAMAALSGGLHFDENAEASIELFDSSEVTLPLNIGAHSGRTDEDLQFFKELADEVDLIHKHWCGRTDFIMSLALGMNGFAGNPVDYFQLQAAVYLHDVGMKFIPDKVLLKQGRYTEKEKALLRAHPSWAIEHFDLMENWEDAAWIVYQHHEKYNGSGYPEGTSGNEISPGAQILGIADAFFSIVNRTKRRSLFRAVSEINACIEKDFSEHWVDTFNKVINVQSSRFSATEVHNDKHQH